jgi:prepilin-type N-terminal cleavage/methylation domain-containing protein
MKKSERHRPRQRRVVDVWENMKDQRRHAGELAMRKIAAGFTLVEIMIVVAIIALLAVLAVPSFMRSRVSARTNSCINNLRLIDHAKEMWAASNSRSLGDAVDTTAVNTYLRIVP